MAVYIQAQISCCWHRVILTVHANISEKFAVLLLQKSCRAEKESFCLHISCAHTGSFLLDTSDGDSLQPTYIRTNYTKRVHTLTLKMETGRSSKTLVISRWKYMDSQSKIPIPEFLFFFSHYCRVLNGVTIFLSHETHVYYVHILSSDQKLSFLNIWHCFMISAIVLWYQFQYQSQILLKIILITLCCWRTFCILFCEMCTYWIVLLSVDVIKFVFYIDIARPIHLKCAAISSRASVMHYNWL
jgi:hypothetical protein